MTAAFREFPTLHISTCATAACCTTRISACIRHTAVRRATRRVWMRPGQSTDYYSVENSRFDAPTNGTASSLSLPSPLPYLVYLSSPINGWTPAAPFSLFYPFHTCSYLKIVLASPLLFTLRRIRFFSVLIVQVWRWMIAESNTKPKIRSHQSVPVP